MKHQDSKVTKAFKQNNSAISSQDQQYLQEAIEIQSCHSRRNPTTWAENQAKLVQDQNTNDKRHIQNLFASKSLFHERVQTSRRRHTITKDKKMLLEAVIDLGISGNFAAQILGLTSSSRLMRNLSIQREQREAEIE